LLLAFRALFSQFILAAQILDMKGYYLYDRWHRKKCKGAHAFILGYDITSSDSFRHVLKWLNYLESPDLKRNGVLIGNKCDLVHHRQVTQEQGQALADKYGWSFLETSAKSGQNVTEAFMAAARIGISSGLGYPESLAVSEVKLQPNNSLQRMTKPILPGGMSLLSVGLTLLQSGAQMVFETAAKTKAGAKAVSCHVHDPAALFKKWDSVFIAIGSRSFAFGSTAEKAFTAAQEARQSSFGKKIHQTFALEGCRATAAAEFDGRNHIMVVEYPNSDPARSKHHFAFDDRQLRDAFVQMLEVR
jgi:hypothetical protein